MRRRSPPARRPIEAAAGGGGVEDGFLYGFQAVQSLLQRSPTRLLELRLQSSRSDRRIQELANQAAAADIPTHRLPLAELDRLFPSARHQGIVARCRLAASLSEDDLPPLLASATSEPLLLVLDGVQDPHNLGACLRTADGAGVTAAIAPRDRAVGLTPTVRKVACGAAESLPFIQVTNLARTLTSLMERGIHIVGTAGDASESLYDADLRGPVALVLGAEEKGLRRLTRAHCDQMVQIPLQGTVESLNVSVAAGIVLFEALRQRARETCTGGK